MILTEVTLSQNKTGLHRTRRLDTCPSIDQFWPAWVHPVRPLPSSSRFPDSTFVSVNQSVVSNGLIMWIGHSKDIRKLTIWA